MGKYNFENIVEVLKDIAYIAGNYLKKEKNNKIFVKEKTSAKDLVTIFDVEIQALIIKYLKEKYSEACFVAEEMNNYDEILLSELLFVIDPIDGTANFVKAVEYSAISIGCFSFGEPMAGVVYNPYSDEMFWAVKGKGAYLNDKRIRATHTSAAQSLVLFGTSPYDCDTTEETFEKIKRIYEKCLDIRRFGSSALDLCNVACGRAGLYFEGRLSLWDYAAASVVLSEAGGILCDYCGNPIKYSLDKTSIVAGKKEIIEEFNILER